MYKLFGKLFIKNYKDLNDEKVRVKYASMSGILGIVSNSLLGLLKVVLGIMTASVSIITDAINNITDSMSSVVTIVGYKMSSKGADEDHPFGHQRIEFISALIISVSMVAIAVLLFKESLDKVLNPEEVKFSYVTVILLTVSVFVKLWQCFFYRSIGKAINSISIKAQSRDSLNDAVSTVFVIIATIVYLIFDVNIDGYIGMALSVYVIISGIGLIKESSSPLIGTIPDKEIINGYKREIKSYDGVLGVHDIVCHTYGPTKLFMTAHAEVDSRVPILESHEIIDKIEKDFRMKHNIDLTIHMDPVNYDDEYTNSLRMALRERVKAIDERMDIHDFRIVKGEKNTNVIFDCEIPAGFKYSKDETRELLTNIIKEMNSSFTPIIQVEQLYDRN